MAKSAAKKHRDKLVREGRRNPENQRGVFALVDLSTRRTKTKKEKLNQNKHKKRLSDYSHDSMDKRSFYFVS